MRSTLFKTVTAISLIASMFLTVSPLTVQASTAKPAVKVSVKKKIKKPVVRKYRTSVSRIKGADEKEISDPTSRCLTPAIKAKHDAAVKQMNADIEKAGPGFEDAVKNYQTHIELIWAAMSEPYCGFGKGQVATVVKAFDKSVNASRTKFLSATKK